MGSTWQISQFFLGQKAKSVKFLPIESRTFYDYSLVATGSYNEEQNEITVWGLRYEETMDGIKWENSKIDSAPHQGDVTELCYAKLQEADACLLVSGSTTGHLNYYTVKLNEQAPLPLTLESLSSNAIHRGPVNSIDVCGTHVISAGHDGTISLVRTDGNLSDAPRRILNADSMPINRVQNRFPHKLQPEFITASTCLKIWQDTKLAHELKDVGAPVAIHSVAIHPTQPDIIAAGNADGVLTIWDIKMNSAPLSRVSYSSAPLWAAGFHPTNVNQLVTGGEDGALIAWDVTRMLEQHHSQQRRSGSAHVDMSLTYQTFLGINDIDFHTSSGNIVCVSDNDGLCLLSPL